MYREELIQMGNKVLPMEEDLLSKVGKGYSDLLSQAEVSLYITLGKLMECFHGTYSMTPNNFVDDRTKGVKLLSNCIGLAVMIDHGHGIDYETAEFTIESKPFTCSSLYHIHAMDVKLAGVIELGLSLGFTFEEITHNFSYWGKRVN